MMQSRGRSERDGGIARGRSCCGGREPGGDGGVCGRRLIGFILGGGGGVFCVGGIGVFGVGGEMW